LAKSSTPRKKPLEKKPTFVERALEGMTARLEAGETLSDKEVPLYLMMLHAHNSREMLNYKELFVTMQDRVTKVEAHLNTQANLQRVMDSSKRVPNQAYGPPNQNPFPDGR